MPTRRSQSPHKAPNGVSFENPLDRPAKQKDQGVSELLVCLSISCLKPLAGSVHGLLNPNKYLLDQPRSISLFRISNLLDVSTCSLTVSVLSILTISPGANPRPSGGNPLPNGVHRITHSNEEKNNMKPAEKAVLDIFESPNKTENRRPVPRRNSDSSMLDAKDEERRRRERRRREREARSKEGRDGKPRSSRPRRPQGLDIIDKLDVTGLYGPGLIHHDGPFDACNPHRNRKNVRTAPMQAFPAGSLNNALGGSGPVNKSVDYDAFHGRVVEGFSDYNKTRQVDSSHDPYGHNKKLSSSGAENQTVSWDAKEKVEPVHGEATAGLGTSTFFEGTAVSRKDINRRESESENAPLNPGGAGGLSRKRSIAQKIRGISKPRPGANDAPGVTSPDARYVQSPTSPTFVNSTQSAGGRDRMYEKNPFFYEQGVDAKKGPPVSSAAINLHSAHTAGGARPRTASSPRRNRDRAPSSPGRNLYRPNTQEDQLHAPTKDNTGGNGNGTGGGIIGRVKSLRGRKRPERFGGVNA